MVTVVRPAWRENDSRSRATLSASNVSKRPQERAIGFGVGNLWEAGGPDALGSG